MVVHMIRMIYVMNRSNSFYFLSYLLDLYACGEYSYDNLYNYNDSTIAVTDKPLGSSGVESSTSSLTTKSSTVSFDSSAFERQLSISVSNSSIPQQQPTLRENNKITRDPKNGAFTFQVHAEYDLLLHVQKSLDRTRSRNNNADQINNIRLSQIIMRSVDDYCLKKQWMYHIGREKGVAIGRFLEDSLKRGDWINKVSVYLYILYTMSVLNTHANFLLVYLNHNTYRYSLVSILAHTVATRHLF